MCEKREAQLTAKSRSQAAATASIRTQASRQASPGARHKGARRGDSGAAQQQQQQQPAREVFSRISNFSFVCSFSKKYNFFWF